MLARAMRALGHEVLFVLSSQAPLDRPENRYPDIRPPYPGWIHDLTPMWRTYFPTPWRRRAIGLLRSCDFVVLNQVGPSLAGEIGRPALALLTGSDLQYFANPATLRNVWREIHQQPAWVAIPLKLATFPGLIRRQRAGIANAALVGHFARGLVPEADRMMDELGVGDERRTMILMTETDRIACAPQPANPVPRVFCATRLNWKRPVPKGYVELDYKGSDIMVRGLGLFLRETRTRLDIRLVRKGLHVAETVELVRSEGFADQVTWLDEMTQDDVLSEYRAADILFEQLDHSVVGMAGLDGMATGRPLIANARAELIEPEIGESSPICHATTPAEVAAQLRRLALSPHERERVGRASRQYVERNLSAESVARRVLARMEPVAGTPR